MSRKYTVQYRILVACVVERVIIHTMVPQMCIADGIIEYEGFL
jgi:hypothetical protein